VSFIITNTMIFKKKIKAGFTLVELAIVLVIIGLVGGGVLVGKDLISAAEVRSQISQIIKYNTTVNTFKLKYNYLPGDIPASEALANGFATRIGTAGRGDGDGQLQAYPTLPSGMHYNGGENLLFWEDLSSSGLVDGSFNTFVDGTTLAGIASSNLYKYFPAAKIGNGNYVVAWGGNYTGAGGISNLAANNYFAVLIPDGMKAGWWANPSSFTGMTVAQSYNIDLKIDDGLPQTGSVITIYPNSCSNGNYVYWAAGAHTDYTTCSNLVLSSGVNRTQIFPYTVAVTASPTTCFDNNGSVSGTAQTYSMSQNGGSGINCALSFKFQ